jgi:hypothetical protein
MESLIYQAFFDFGQKKSASIPFAITPIVQDLSARPIGLPPVFRLIPIYIGTTRPVLATIIELSQLKFFC